MLLALRKKGTFRQGTQAARRSLKRQEKEPPPPHRELTESSVPCQHLELSPVSPHVRLLMDRIVRYYICLLFKPLNW